MSRMLRNLVLAVTAGTVLAGTADAQLLGVAARPPLNLPVPTNNLPVAGPVLQNVLGRPGAQQIVNRTLDSVGDGTEQIAGAGQTTLLELRRLRLQQIIRSNRTTVEDDGRGLPVRRGLPRWPSGRSARRAFPRNSLGGKRENPQWGPAWALTAAGTPLATSTWYV